MKKFDNNAFNEIRDVTWLKTSPDERRLIYGVGGECQEKDKALSWIYLYTPETGESKQLTYLGEEGGAGWLDENTIFFSAARGEVKALMEDKSKPLTVFYALDVRGGEARELFRVPIATATALAVDPDRFILYGIHNNSPEGDGEHKLYEVYDEHPYHQDGRGYVNKLRARIYRYTLSSDTLTPITEPMFQANTIMNTRMPPVLSRDKKRLYYWGETVTAITSPCQDAYVYHLETEETALLFHNSRYMLEDIFELGERVYFLGLVLAGSDFYATDLISIGPGETEYRVDLSNDLFITGAWPDGEEILVACAEHDKKRFYSFRPGQELRPRFTPDYLQESGMEKLGGKWYFAGRRPLGMRQLVECGDAGCKAVTDVGRAFLESYTFSPNEPVQVTCKEGHTVYGWVIKPHGYMEGRRYPGVLMIHGGPQSAYWDVLNFTMQRLAAEGYFVFFCNPRGSTNYGKAHMDLEGKFGTVDYDDFMAFTDHVLEQYSDLDPNRLGVTGGSYGGYMTNWIVGHTDRFRGAVAQRSITNWISMYGCSDIPYFIDWGQQGNPWHNIEKLWFHSPLKYADRVKTPTLLLQNDKDFRCPVEQAEQMHTALLHFGVPTRMVLFHGASHTVMTPVQRRKNDDEVIAWFDKYVKQ